MREKWRSRGSAALCACAVLLASLSVTPVRAQDAAPAAEGTLTGKVIDASTGDPIIEAGIEVIGVGRKVRTDLDGKYTIKLAPGTYELRVFAPLYQGARLQKVLVQPGQVAKVDAALVPQGQAGVQVVEVVAQADKAAEATQLIQRKKSAVVSDNISAETIKKSTDSNAGEIVTRVPGVTVKNNKFFVVRGLDERYTSALLNGSRLSSTDPEKRVVPLDLFPSDFVEAINIFKTFEPDLPGDFSAGLADIRLRNFPDRFTLSLGASVGANSDSTFQRFRTYSGAGTSDYFGFGTDERELPAEFPSTLRSGPNQADARRQAFAHALPDVWDPKPQTALPNFDGNFFVGDTWGPLGASLSGIYTTEYKSHNNEIDRQFTNPDRVIPSSDFIYNTDTFETRLGGVFSSAYQLSPDHRITFRSLVDRNTTDEVKEGRGGVEAQGGAPRTTSELQYTEQRLAFGQLGGEHHWPVLDVNWRTAFTQTTENVPDTRIVTRQGGGFTNDSFGGIRYFTNLEEHLTDSAVDFTVPFTMHIPFTQIGSDLPAKFKFGPAYAYRDNDFQLRRFRNRDQHGTYAPSLDLNLPTEVLFAPDNIGPFRAFDFREDGLPGDSFSGTHEIAAGYGMVDMPLFPGLKDEDGTIRHQVRLVTGVRTEYSYIFLNTVNVSGQSVTIPKNNLDPLPAINLVYSPREDMNVRVGYSQAVSRPDFHEQSPVQFPEPRGLRPFQGNPALIEAHIDNYDLRWEWFFSPLEIVSLSFFYKTLDKPIENTVISNGGFPLDSVANSESGNVVGFEFEGRKNMGWISPRLTDLGVLANVTYADSSVTVPTGGLFRATNPHRALQGTSPYVVNAALNYTQSLLGEVRFLYNTFGERITEAGAFGLDDIFEQPRHEIDFVWLRQIHPFGTPLNAKLGIENILNDRYQFTEGGLVQQRYRTGVKFTFGVSYSY